MKKYFLLLIALTLCISHAWAYDFSAVAPSGQTLYYNIVDGNAQVTRQSDSYPFYSPNITGDLEIPSSVTYNGTNYSVTAIGEYAFSRSDITSVIIPNSVTTIKNGAFLNSGIRSVTIGNSVTSIERSAFECWGVTRVDYTGDIAGWCNIDFADHSSNPNWYANAHNLYIGGNPVTGALVIPSGVMAIKDYAFCYCSGLTSVTIPSSMNHIGNNAFYGCTGLTRVDYTGNIAGWCTIEIWSCPNKYAHNLYINGQQVTGHLEIPSGVTSIGSGVFSYCSGLTSVTIPNSVTAIGGEAFYNCSGLTSVTIGNSVTSIGAGAFEDCSSLSSVTIPNSVTAIEEGAFYGCSGLTSVTIGNSVTEIGEESFGECSRLTSIYSLSVNPPTIDDDTFEDVDKNIPLFVPTESVYRYTNAFGWSDFTNIIGISTQGIDEVEVSVIRCMGDRVIVNGAVDEMISIFDITGHMIVHEQAVEGKAYTMPNAGVYMVQVGNHPAEKVVVIR